jgi:hypothetical protein
MKNCLTDSGSWEMGREEEASSGETDRELACVAEELAVVQGMNGVRVSYLSLR